MAVIGYPNYQAVAKDFRHARLFLWGGMSGEFGGFVGSVRGQYRNTSTRTHVLIAAKLTTYLRVAISAGPSTFLGEIVKVTNFSTGYTGTGDIIQLPTERGNHGYATSLQSGDVRLSNSGTAMTSGVHDAFPAFGAASIANVVVTCPGAATVDQASDADEFCPPDGFGIPLAPGDGLIMRAGSAVGTSGQVSMGWRLLMAEL